MTLNDTDTVFIKQLDLDVERRIKFWIVSAVLAQVITLLPVIFFLGGIYSDGRVALNMLQEQQMELARRGNWIQDREKWEMAMENWATPKGFERPHYQRRGKDE